MIKFNADKFCESLNSSHYLHNTNYKAAGISCYKENDHTFILTHEDPIGGIEEARILIRFNDNYDKYTIKCISIDTNLDLSEYEKQNYMNAYDCLPDIIKDNYDIDLNNLIDVCRIVDINLNHTIYDFYDYLYDNNKSRLYICGFDDMWNYEDDNFDSMFSADMFLLNENLLYIDINHGPNNIINIKYYANDNDFGYEFISNIDELSIHTVITSTEQFNELVEKVADAIKYEYEYISDLLLEAL